MVGDKILKNIQYVISHRNYFLLFIFVSIAVFTALYFFTLATTNYNLETFISSNGFYYVVFTMLMFVVISLLTGIWASLIVYRLKCGAGTNFQITSTSFAGFISALLGAGCPTCGSLILGFLGMPLALSFLPFKGLELRALSIVFLLISILFLSKDFGSCRKYDRYV